MSRSLLGLLAAFATGALLAGALAAWWTSGPEDAAPSAERSATAPEPSGPPPRPQSEDPLAIPEDQLARLMEQLREVEGAPSEEDARQADAPPPLPPTQVQYSVPEKYETQRLSEVDHRLLGAWDDAPQDGPPGRHRSFVLVVEPDLTDRQLESLARDVWQLHHDADRLDVRIYDRENAATDARVSDGGRYAHRHQVAQVIRHRGLDVDVIRVRGRVVGP